MAITYNNQEIQISASSQKVSVDVVYARPEDIIRIDFDIKKVKVTFVDGDLDLIFPNGSIVSLASYATLAFGSNAPKIYDNDNNLISLEDLLENVQVVKPEDSILILANRDKSQLVQNDEVVNKIIMATINTGDLQGGNPIAGVGDISIPTTGMNSPIIDKTGSVANFNQKKGIGDYLNNNNTTYRKGNSDSENILPGNTNLLPQPNLTYNFLFGDSGVLGAPKTINNENADYYAIKFGTGDTKDTFSQLLPVNMSNLGGSYKDKIFDSHAVDGIIKRILKLDYSGGIFPQSISISGIPADKDSLGNQLFNLYLKAGGTSRISYDPVANKYMLTQLDPLGKLELFFEFYDTIMDQNINIKFSVLYVDAKTSETKLMETFYDVGIRSVNQKSDLSLNSVVINKGASGILIDAANAGTGNKIFIGGNVSNSFTSQSGNNLVFTGGGDDTINISGEGTKSVIYGSTGYNFIVGSGGEENNDWLIYSNDKKYNDFIESPVIKDSYYNTLKHGISLQFYFGVDRNEVSDLWNELGVSGDVNGLRNQATPNFVKSFNSMTVIGNRNKSISIKNIVGSKEADTFNLYFHGVSQKINIIGGNADADDSLVASRLVIRGRANDTIFIDLGRGDTSTVTSEKFSETAYNFDTKSFNRITSDGSNNLEVQVAYDGKGGYGKKEIYITANADLKEDHKSLADFSQLTFNSPEGHIEFNADNKYNYLDYKGVEGKTRDYFYNFTHIKGSTGNDIFYGNSNSHSYHFDGHEHRNNNGKENEKYEGNVLNYAKSIGGVTFNAADGLIYKTNNPNIQHISDYSKFIDKADSYVNIQTIVLSNMDNVIVASNQYNIGKDNSAERRDNPDIILGSSSNTLRYDLDDNIESIEVEADNLKVIKKGGLGGTDFYHKTQERSGSVKYVGTAGDDMFYGGIKYISSFIGNGGNNTLSYKNVGSDISLSIDILKGLVTGNGKRDTFENIQNIIGGDGNDDFFISEFDPTNKDERKKIGEINIDGGGGINTFRFSGTKIDNLSKKHFGLNFDVSSGDIKFFDTNEEEINDIKIDLSKHINSISGTIKCDLFIASQDKDFQFDGVGNNGVYVDEETKIYGNTLDYSNFTNNLTIDLINKVVIKSESENRKDGFKNIQAFKGGKGNDIFVLNHLIDDKIRFFDGGEGENKLSYEHNFQILYFDFEAGIIFFNDTEKNTVFDGFRNISSFKGSKGSNTFILSDHINFNDYSNNSIINIEGGAGNNTLDFSKWSVALGDDATPFVLRSDGTISNTNNDTKITYNWTNINSVIGSKLGDYFVIDNEEKYFFLDGNADTADGQNNVLDYSKLNSAVVLNVSTGVVSRSNNLVSDTIKNIQQVMLTTKDDIVTFLNEDKGFLPNISVIDGNSGNNTIDFKQSLSDVEVYIEAKGFNIKSNNKINFINFNIINASKGNSTFFATDETNGATVYLNGNVNLPQNKLSVLDLTQLAGNLTYYNYNQSDDIADKSQLGLLTWADNKKANLITQNINKILLNDGNSKIIASARNHTHYVGGGGKNSNNMIDYSEVNDSIYVVIDSDNIKVNFESQGGEDKISNFQLIKGTKNNDVFLVTNLENISTGVEYDGFEGENTFSFIRVTTNVEIDISLANIQVKDNIVKLTNVKHLILSNQDDVIKITADNILFDTVDGANGNNTIDITNGGKITFNKEGKLDLVLSNIPNKAISIQNIQNIQTTTTTGNIFYAPYGVSLSFKVIGSQNSDVNILSYANTASLVEVDFNTNSVVKGNKTDKFAGINYFVGGLFQSTTFYLSKDSLDNFDTIYINTKEAPVAQDVVDDFVSIVKLGDGAKFYVAPRTIEGSRVKYEWQHISTINFTNNQIVIASFDENYNYYWKKMGSDTVEGAVLVFDASQSKEGNNYKDGYIIFDVNNRQIQTFDGTTKKSTSNFNVLSTIIGTGSEKDIFYAGSDSINIQGGLNSGQGTVNYSRYSTKDGIVVTFAADNSAVVTDFANPTKKDTVKFIKRYVGTTGNDTFIISQNKGQDVIEINGNSGIYNKVDFSQLTEGNSAITLDTTQGIPKGDYNYLFKNISTFKLTSNDDLVLGSMSNKGFSKDGGATSIIIDGGGGNNTLDYTVYIKGTKDKQNNINVDLQMGVITKVGYEDGVAVTTNDNISVAEKGKSVINFKNIILSGVYTSNTLIVSNGKNNPADTYINVAIKDVTPGLSQVVSLENVEEEIKFTWNGSAISGSIGGQSVLYEGFNNIRLSKLDSVLIIDKPTNMLEDKGAIHGSGGKNTLMFTNNESNSSVVINLNLEILNISIDGSKNYKYNLFNFQVFDLGFASNTFLGKDVGDFSVIFSKANSKNVIDYSSISSSFVNLVIDGITNEGAQITLNKLSITNASVVNGVDKVYNIKEIILSNSDDIVDIKNNDNGPVIFLDGKKGTNTISFEKSWEGPVDIQSVTDGVIKIKGYEFVNFSKIILTQNDDHIKLKKENIITIDGGSGNNIADYSDVEFNSTVLVSEYETIVTGNVRRINIKVNKEGKYVDNLTRFNNLIMGKNSSTVYTAYFVEQVPGNANSFSIDFNALDISKVNNVMDYSKMAGAVNGIKAHVRFENNTNFAEIWRDNKKTSESLKDNLLGITNILGTNKGDIFNIDINVKNLTINAGLDNLGELNLNYVEGNDAKVFVWNLNNRTVAKGSESGNAKVFLTFNGFKNLGGVVSNDTKIDNIFFIYSFDVGYNIVTNSKASSNSVITANFGNVKVNSDVNYIIEFDNNVEGAISVKAYDANNKEKSVRLAGITYIVGNTFNVNSFYLSLNRSSDNIRPYIIEGRGATGGKLDNIEINASIAGYNDSNINFNIKSGGSLILKQEGYANLTIKNIPLVKFSGNMLYNLKFNNESKDSYLNLVCDSVDTKIILDFNNIVAKDYVLALDENTIALRLNSENIHINSNDIYSVLLSNDSEGKVILRDGFDTTKSKDIDSFSNIDLSNFTKNKFELTISGAKNGESYTVNTSIDKLNFVNKKDIEVFLGAKNYELNININNFKDINQNVLISANPTNYINKSIVTVKELGATDGSANMNLEVRDDTRTIFFREGSSPSRVIVENAKYLDFSYQAANWNVKLFQSYSYFSGGDNNQQGLGLVMKFKATKLVIDFTDFNGTRIGLQGVQSDGSGQYFGYFIGFNNQMPDWYTKKGVASIGGFDNSIYNDSTIILPDKGIEFYITYGWLNKYINLVESKQVSKGITLDGDASFLNSVNVNYDKDITTFFTGYKFTYTVKNNKVNTAASDYELTEITDKQGKTVTGFKFNIKNLGSVTGTDGVHSKYIILDNTPLFILGSKDARTEVVFGSSNNVVNFDNKPVDMFVASSTVAGAQPFVDIKFYGNLGGFNINLDKVQILDLTYIKNYQNKVVFTFNTFPISSSLGFYPFLIVPQGNRGPVDSLEKVTKHILDLSPLGILNIVGSDMDIAINRINEIKISSTNNNHDKNYFVVKYFYEFINPAVVTHYYVDDVEHSYILNGGNYVPLRNTITYRSKSVASVDATKALVNKKNANGEVRGTDFYSRVSSIRYTSDLKAEDKKFFERGKSISNDEYNTSRSASDDKIYLSFYDNHREIRSANSDLQSFVFDSKTLNLYIAFDGIGRVNSKTVIDVQNIEKLFLAHEGKDHYRVFFVNNNMYNAVTGENKVFDTSGYFTVVDTNNGNIVYFTGRDIKQYWKSFEDFLNNHDSNNTANIDQVNSYEEMLKAVDQNIKTDPFKPNIEEPDNRESNSENTNHAANIDSEDVDDVNDNASITDAALVADPLAYNNEVSNGNYNDSLDTALNVLDNETYPEQVTFENNLSDALDVLDNQDSIDNISNHVFNDIQGNTIQDDSDEFTEVLSTISAVESNVLDSDTMVPTMESDINHSDPSYKVEDSVNKQNHINGNNHR